MLTGNLNGQQESAIPLMKSRRLWGPLIQRHNLQGQIDEIKDSQPLISRIRNNLLIEQAYFSDQREPLFTDVKPTLMLTRIDYQSEIPLKLELQFSNETSFTIKDQSGTVIAHSNLGSPIQGDNYSFVVERLDNISLSGKSFAIRLDPLDFTARSFTNQLTIKPDEKSSKVLKLSLAHSNRTLASDLLNDLMEGYQEHLREEHKQVASAQLDYLERRRYESNQNLEKLIVDYALQLSRDLPNSGIIDSEKELAVLEGQKAKLRQSIITIDLELSRLDKNRDAESYLNTLGASKDLPELVRQTISTINELKQRRDRLVLALSKTPTPESHCFEEQFETQVTSLLAVNNDIDRMNHLYHFVESDDVATLLEELSHNSSPMLKLWYNKLLQSDSSPNHESWEEHKAHFKGYLNHYLRLSKVHQRLMEERLALQQHNVDDQLQGMDLPTANTIYLDLNHRLNDTQGEIRQNSFILDQVADPSFEVSSLSGLLHDPVSHGLIDRYSVLSMSLKDSTIRSPKEQDRIKEELNNCRAFLLYHLQQANQLLKLREEFLGQKIDSIQGAMLDLTHQQVSVLEKHLQDYTDSHIDQLREQRGFLSQFLKDINKQMSSLPLKWGAEQMIKHQAKINGSIVEEVSKLVETKNIAHHLETIQSSPLDLAIPAVLPKRPMLHLFVTLGLILGAGFGAVYTLAMGLWRGIEVSEANLKLANQYTAGYVPPRKLEHKYRPFENPKQLTTLRRLTAHLFRDVSSPQDKRVLLLTGRGADYSKALAILLAKKGLRVLRLRLSFDQESTTQMAGLLQVLEGSAAKPTISTLDGYDSIEAGGISVHGHELLHSQRYRDLLDNLSQKYDAILAVHTAPPKSAEAESLCHQFNRIAVTIADEKVQDIEFYSNLSLTKRIAFIMSC
jgi:tyrosine-protein kinase Etk/Wzc